MEPGETATSGKEQREQQEYWLKRAGDALGHYLAAGGKVGVMVGDATLIVVPEDAGVMIDAAIERGRLMHRMGVTAYPETEGVATP